MSFFLVGISARDTPDRTLHRQVQCSCRNRTLRRGAPPAGPATSDAVDFCSLRPRPLWLSHSIDWIDLTTPWRAFAPDGPFPLTLDSRVLSIPVLFTRRLMRLVSTFALQRWVTCPAMAAASGPIHARTAASPETGVLFTGGRSVRSSGIGPPDGGPCGLLNLPGNGRRIRRPTRTSP